MVRITDKYYDANRLRIIDNDDRVFEGSVLYILCAPDYEQNEEAIAITQDDGSGVDLNGADIKRIEILN